MKQSTVTRAFEAWNVGKILDGLPAVPDKVVFALVPDQDETVPVSRDEGMPIAAHIKHTADITQAGVLNDNAVVYSVVLDTTVGDWEYNWLGLVDSKTDTVLMVVHVRAQQKLKTHNGQQGNSLTRNLSMQFDGAAEATQINVSAQTWQIDFSARLFSMDEALRVAMLDYYGAAAFLNDGLTVRLAGTRATVAPGVGYVGGLRVQLDEAQTVTATANTSVWLDVSRQGTVTGAWSDRVVIKVANTLENYTDVSGYRHYVTKLATISNGQLTDARPVSPIVALDERFLPIKGTAVAASKLATVRKIAGVAFDGTKDIALTPENVGALPSGGTAAASIRLVTSRKIAGVAFDGTANIDLPGVNTTGHQATTGNAATATTLQMPRKINGVPFDGSADIGVNTLVSRGRVPALSGNNQGTAGIQMYEAYGNGYPTPYDGLCRSPCRLYATSGGIDGGFSSARFNASGAHGTSGGRSGDGKDAVTGERPITARCHSVIGCHQPPGAQRAAYCGCTGTSGSIQQCECHQKPVGQFCR